MDRYMENLWLSHNDLQLKIYNEKKNLLILAEEEIIPGKLNYSILEISNSDISAGFNIIKPWNYTITNDKLIPFKRKIHRGIELHTLIPLLKNSWRPCDKNNLPENNTDVLVVVSYNNDNTELFGSAKWHLGTFKKTLFFQPHVKGSFVKDITLYRYQNYYNNDIYTSKLRMHNIPFYKALKWVSLDTIIKKIERKNGNSKNEAAIHNME